MWTRSLLKKNAWENLKGYYWPALGVTLLSAIMGANGGGFSAGGGGGGSSYSNYESSGSSFEDMDPKLLAVIITVFVVVFLVMMAFSIAFTVFVGNPTLCGEHKYFVTARNGNQQFNHMFDNFRRGNYMATVKTMFFWRGEIWLWYLLFIIPGIIKTYEYTLVPYLVAENPHIDRKRAKEISRQTMEGEKWNFFVLQLSFIGWYLLGYCACCIGAIAVVPYQQATNAEFYMCMRAKMLSFGYTTEEELTGGISNGMSGSNPADPNGSAGSYNETNFTANAYNVPNTSSQNPYNMQNPYGASGSGQVNLQKPDTPQSHEMPGVDNFNDPNNPYNQ